MTLIKSFEDKNANFRLEKEENISNTRFHKYYVKNDNQIVMTAFHYKSVNDYFSMLVEEYLEGKK